MSIARIDRAGAAVPVLLALSTLLVLIAAMVHHDPEPPAPTKLQMARAFAALDVSPENLAATGLDGNATTALLSGIEAAMQSNGAHVCTLLDDTRTKHALVVQLREAARTQAATLQELATAQSDLESAQASLDAELSRIRTAAQGSLPAQIWGHWSQLASPARADLPLHLRTLDLDDQARAQLRDALTARRIASQQDYELDQATAALLHNAKSHTDATTMLNNLESNLHDVRAAWNSFFSP